MMAEEMKRKRRNNAALFSNKKGGIDLEDLLRIGVVTTTHGLRGEVKVFPTTDDPRRFDDCDEVVLIKKCENHPLQWENHPLQRENHPFKQERHLLHVERVKYFKNIVIVKFKEFNDINEVEQFRKCDIMVTREHAVPLEEGEYFFCDVIGAAVSEEDGTPIGTVKDVMETGANNVFVIEMEDGREVLFPSIPDCIKKIDVENKQIVAHIMPGLID